MSDEREGGLGALLAAGGRWWMIPLGVGLLLLLGALVALQLTHGRMPAAYTVGG